MMTCKRTDNLLDVFHNHHRRIVVHGPAMARARLADLRKEAESCLPDGSPPLGTLVKLAVRRRDAARIEPDEERAYVEWWKWAG
jgi:hypothetical protein